MATWDFRFEAGALVRKSLLFQFKAEAVKAGLTFEVIADDGGWISTTYLIRVSGPDRAVATYLDAVTRWAKAQREAGKTQ